MHKQKPTCIDLFAGAGGFSLGFQKAGFEVIAAVEISKDACATLRANKSRAFPKMQIIQEDITKLSGKDLMKRVGIKKGELSMIIGGPPCQGFTTISSRRSINDPRSKLMHEFIRMVKEIKSKGFMIENVPGLFYFKDFFILLMKLLEKCGYVVRCLMMDACSYGVPQRRRRIFIQGVRKDLDSLPTFPPPENFDPEHLKGWMPPALVAQKCFAHHGFPKEEVKDLWWNKKLGIQMNKKRAAEQVDKAISLIIAEGVMGTLKKVYK